MIYHLRFIHLGMERRKPPKKPKIKKIKCSVCEIKLAPNELDEHLCSNDENIQCEYCPESFKATVKLLEHLKRSHDEKKLYRCEKCPRFFAMIRLKEYHLHRHIGESKSFICDICTKSFATNFLLNLHVQRHTTEKRKTFDTISKERILVFYLNYSISYFKRICAMNAVNHLSFLHNCSDIEILIIRKNSNAQIVRNFYTVYTAYVDIVQCIKI